MLLFKQVLHTHGVILSYIARYCKYFSSKLLLGTAKYFRQRGELPGEAESGGKMRAGILNPPGTAAGTRP